MSFARPEGGIPGGMQEREPDGLEYFAGIRLVNEVSERNGIAVDGKRLKPDGSHYCVVHDQEMSVELTPPSATIFGRPRTGARNGKATARQRMKIDTGPIAHVFN